MPTTQPNVKNGRIESETWMETSENRWTRVDDQIGILRIHEELPLVSAAAFNCARHTEATGELVVLHHDKPMPSEPTELYRGTDPEEAREAAHEFMEAH